jgi:tetratricopeptide (TPR) repeat protein
VDYWRGDWIASRRHFDEAVHLEFPGIIAGAGWGFRLLLTACEGDLARTLAMFAERREALPPPGSPSLMGRWVMLLTAAEALSVAGAHQEAFALYPKVLEAIGTGNVVRVWDSRVLQSIAGLTAASGRRWKQAEDHFRLACHLADGMQHRIDQADARRYYASMLIEREDAGDRDRARALLDEAIAAYTSIGMPRHEAMARELLHTATR